MQLVYRLDDAGTTQYPQMESLIKAACLPDLQSRELANQGIQYMSKK